MQHILETHIVPGQYMHFFKEPKKSEPITIVKTTEKKKKRMAQKLNYLIPEIQSAMDLAAQEPFLKRILKGMQFPKIEADSQKLILHYSLNQKQNFEQREKNLDISKGLIYKYLVRQVPARKFPSRLEFRPYDFKLEKLDRIYSKIQKELGF